jgi:hypothetical protein
MREIIAQQGQTWDMIAKIYMGDEVFTKDVMLANCHMSSIAVFDGGETVNIPEDTDTDEDYAG